MCIRRGAGGATEGIGTRAGGTEQERSFFRTSKILDLIARSYKRGKHLGLNGLCISKMIGTLAAQAALCLRMAYNNMNQNLASNSKAEVASRSQESWRISGPIRRIRGRMDTAFGHNESNAGNARIRSARRPRSSVVPLTSFKTEAFEIRVRCVARRKRLPVGAGFRRLRIHVHSTPASASEAIAA